MGTRLIGERVMNAPTRVRIRERHRPTGTALNNACVRCHDDWPCDAIMALDDLEKTEAAFRRLVTWPF